MVYIEGPMGYRFEFEFDSKNKILLARFEGQLTNEGAVEYHDALGRNWRATGARAGIWELSAATEFSVSSGFLRNLAERNPITARVIDHASIIGVVGDAGYGLMRMFQISAEQRLPLQDVVRSVEEALA